MTQLSDLTARKREIAILVGQRMSYRDIASKLKHLRSYQDEHVSERTVQMHVTAIARELGEDDLPPKIRVMLWVRKQQGPKAA